MKLNAFLLLNFLISLASCSGQTSAKSTIPNKLNAKIAIGDTVSEPGNNIMLVYQDKKNNYWFGSWKDGLYRHDGKTIIHFTTKSGLADNRIEEIKEDQSGNIYFNTSKGISKFDGQNFTTLSVANSNGQWKLEPDDLWFRQGWDSGFVYRYDGNSLSKLHFPKTQPGDEYLRNHPNSKFSPYCVYSIYKDIKGNIWFGTNPLGVCRYNGKSFDWITESDVTELHDGPANGVRSLVEDKDGYFWFNTMYRYKVYGNSAGKQTFYSRENSIGSLDGKENSNLNEFLSITKDNNNEIWIATYIDGIWRYNGKNIVHYSVKEGTKDITVFSIYKDNAGNIWLGTHENGVYKFNGQLFERFKFS